MPGTVRTEGSSLRDNINDLMLMTKSVKKKNNNKRGARESVEEDEMNDAKRPNIADSSNTEACFFSSLP